jgi:Eco57I restriction-modification methylase
LRNLRAELDRHLAPAYGIDRNNIINETAYQERYKQWQKSHQPFHWWVEFYEIMNGGGFDVIIGNPPYVEYNKKTFPYTIQGFETLRCSNLYPYIIERSHHLLSSEGHHGMVVPLSAFATKNMIPLINGLERWFPQTWLSFYHFRPSMLFSGGKVASIPTAVYLAKAGGEILRFSTNVNKWRTEQRNLLFTHLMYSPITIPKDPENQHYYPHFGVACENSIMKKLLRHRCVNNYLSKVSNQNTMYYREAGGLYWKIFINFPWPYQSISNKQCYFQECYDRDVFVALFNSSLFWWYYTVTFDTFHQKDYMLFGFRFLYPEDKIIVDGLRKRGSLLIADFQRHAKHLKRDKTGSYTIYARKSKPLIDEIDRVLAQHYGFTDEELDFIINYDIKYRMGLNEDD